MENKDLNKIAGILLFGAYPFTYCCYNDKYEWFNAAFAEQNNPFTDLWNNRYLNLIFGALSVSLYVNYKFIKSFWSSVIFGLSVSGLIDSAIFNISKFTWSDVIMITITLLTSYYNHIYVRQRR